MKILLSNDDGYQSPGLRALADALAEVADITVVAPDRNQSGASNSLTLDVPLRVGTSDTGARFVNGTPTDCVHLAITGLLDEEPDMVISGINDGPNLGDDVHYSGTVAAAMEGRFLGFSAVAISLAADDPRHYPTAARVARQLVERLERDPLPAGTILNVNVPDVPYESLAGIRATRLGNRHRAGPVVCTRDPRNRPIFWVGPSGAGQETGPGTDFHAIENGYVSVTPLQIDLTHHAAVPIIGNWLEISRR
ncbi:MAG: 5'/3'-nucleotidase SurE [Gammaproteobacteria bacterium]